MPQLAGEIFVYQAQNSPYSSCARRTHACGGPTVIGLTRRQVSVPWGVKSIANSSRKNAQCLPKSTKSQILAVTELSRSATSVRSPSELRYENPESYCAFCVRPWCSNDLRNDPRQLCALPCGGTARAMGLPAILYGLVPKFPEEP